MVYSLTTVNSILFQCLLRAHYICMNLAVIEHFRHQKHKKLIHCFQYDALFVFENRGLKFCYMYINQLDAQNSCD